MVLDFNYCEFQYSFQEIDQQFPVNSTMNNFIILIIQSLTYCVKKFEMLSKYTTIGELESHFDVK